MVKKIIYVAGALALLAAFPAATFAQTASVVTDVSILPYPKPIPFEVTPGHPLHLQGCGSLKAEGKGFVQFRDINGYLYLAGKGSLAVEDSDLGKVSVFGFQRKIHIGHWVVYIGQGQAKASGYDLDLAFHGKGNVYASGCGGVSFKGYWKGSYQRFFYPRPIPIPMPIELESVLSVTN